MTQMQGAKIKSRLVMLVGQRVDMNILRGSAQPKKNESLNQVFSQSLTENFFLFFEVCWLFYVCIAYKVQRLSCSQSVSQSLIVNHFVRGFTGLLFVD